MGSLALHSGENDTAKPADMIILGKELELLGLPEKTVPLDLAGAIRELVAGVTSPYFGDEFLSKIALAQKNNKDGEYLEYWPNGQVKVSGAFKNGLAEGHIHGWYEDGTDAFKAFYKQGIKQGVHIAIFPPEIRKLKNAYARILVYNRQGQLDGKQITEYPDGRLKVLLRYSNGVLDGKAAAVSPYVDGEREEEYEYKNGNRIPSKHTLETPQP